MPMLFRKILCDNPGLMGSWCSGLTRRPVTAKTTGSNPVDPAIAMPDGMAGAGEQENSRSVRAILRSTDRLFCCSP